MAVSNIGDTANRVFSNERAPRRNWINSISLLRVRTFRMRGDTALSLPGKQGEELPGPVFALVDVGAHSRVADGANAACRASWVSN